jgi:hypothetical protein
LSLFQAVLFVTTVIAFALAELWNLARSRHRQAGMVLLGLGLSLFIAKSLGGFFLTGPSSPVGAQSAWASRYETSPLRVLFLVKYNGSWQASVPS